MTPRRTALIAAALVPPALLATMLVAPTIATADPSVSFTLVGRHISGPADGGAEVSTVMGDRLFSIDGTGIEIVDISDPSAPVLQSTIDLSGYGASITSVAARKGLVAVAMPAASKVAPGTIVVLDADGKVLATATVGANPDMVAFDSSAKRIVVANEGEPEEDAGYGTNPAADPEGSVSIIDVEATTQGSDDDDDDADDDRRPSRDEDDKRKDDDARVTAVKLTVRTATFTDFNAGGPRAGELSADVRLFGPGASVAQDLEPEYVTIEGNRAFVTLQENNAIAEIDLKRARVTAIRPLALKDHSLPGNGLDPSDKDNVIAIANWAVTGMPLPDGIASFETRGRTYLITANEGDARSDWKPYVEDQRIKDVIKNGGVNTFGGRTVTIDPTLLSALNAVKLDGQLGRLKITTAAGRAGGDTDGDGDIDRAQAFGTRSVTIWSTDGTKVWDSGQSIEEAVKAAIPANFNSTNDANEFDTRSDDKGPEPEGVAVGRIGGRTYAFVGLERPGGFVVFDVSNPAAPVLVEYVNSRSFAAGVDPTTSATDSGPEVLTFVSAEDSPNGKPLVVVSNEVSGTVAIWAAS